MENSPKTSVLYNANCPVCNFEIGHYASYAGANALPIRFDDLNSDARTAWGIDADTAARRLYVLQDGKLTSGIPAFLVLWAQMPRYCWLGRIVGLPGVRQVASACYDLSLAFAQACSPWVRMDQTLTGELRCQRAVRRGCSGLAASPRGSRAMSRRAVCGRWPVASGQTLGNCC